MRVYLDVSCLNRPYDDQRQLRVRAETDAVLAVLQRCGTGEWTHVSSSMVVAEIRQMRDPERRARVLAMLPSAADIIMDAGEAELTRAGELRPLGVRPADGVHVAAAEAQSADALLTCDDQLLRVARRHPRRFRVRVCSPVTWIEEHENKTNA